MAGFFARFGKRFAANGTVTNPTDAEADTGWAHLQNGKPTVERFNAVGQWLDEKDNWLFGQLRGVLTRAGMTPVEAGENQLADALRALLGAEAVAFTAAGTADYVVPAQRTRLLVFCTGAGGGATGCNSTRRSGGGGAAGGTAIGWYTVTPGSRVTVTVGAGGAGAAPTVLAASAGGLSSFGTFCTASGGRGSNAESDTGFVAGGVGNTATGGLLNLTGGDGGDGDSSVVVPSGFGGATIWGGSPRASRSATGFAGRAPGAGGGAAYANSSGTGGRGANGIVLVLPIA